MTIVIAMMLVVRLISLVGHRDIFGCSFVEGQVIPHPWGVVPIGNYHWINPTEQLLYDTRTFGLGEWMGTACGLSGSL
jgi:hypothetical protein